MKRPWGWVVAAAVVALAVGSALDPAGVALEPASLRWFLAAPHLLQRVLEHWATVAFLYGQVDVWLLPAALLARPRGGASGRRAALALLLSVLAAGAASEGAKLVVRRERPSVAQGRYVRRPFTQSPWSTADLGLPSGHASVSSAGTLVLARLVPATAPVVYTLAVLCGLQRVASGSHFVSDVVAGWMLGAAVAHLVLRRFRPPADGPPGP